MKRALPLLALLAAAPAAGQVVQIEVDAASRQRIISPLVYGLAFATPAQLQDLNVPLNRWGGNPTSRYNWQVNADNRGQDWYFESIAHESAVAGASADDFITESRAGGAEPMLTIPMVGWVARVGPGRTKLASFSIARYGPQTDRDWQWFPDAGNGIRPDGSFVANDPADASVAANEVFQQGWVQHLVARWGAAGAGGVRYYILDNEPSIWHATHRDVHPVGATMDEVLASTRGYAQRIKAVDPGALVAGPEEWGWAGYFYSGFDLQYAAEHGWGHLPDREAHGNWDYVPWWLDQLRQHQAATGERLLDVFTLHYYPQGGEFSDDVSPAMQLRRNRSTRSLWDPLYVDESWIGDVVKLIPRMRQWTATYYPGTPVGITEYNWGAEGHMNGATAQADLLGIFGREGLHLAARWTTPAASTPAYQAIKMYRNYDGNRSTFGETSVPVRVPNPDALSAFGSWRRRGRSLTVMVVNKAPSGSTSVVVRLNGARARGPAQVWQLSAGVIARRPDVPVVDGTLATTLPAPSVTLLVIPADRPLPGLPRGASALSESPAR
jgi:hypothetical protein